MENEEQAGEELKVVDPRRDPGSEEWGEKFLSPLGLTLADFPGVNFRSYSTRARVHSVWVPVTSVKTDMKFKDSSEKEIAVEMMEKFKTHPR